MAERGGREKNLSGVLQRGKNVEIEGEKNFHVGSIIYVYIIYIRLQSGNERNGNGKVLPRITGE